MAFQRLNGRAASALREIIIKPNALKSALGSVEVSFGNTRVLCTACLEPKAPPHAVEKGQGWLTAEYSMLPGSTPSRTQREVNRGKPSGRTQEIQRLIGRSLRSVTDLKALAGHTMWIDCDVLEADGGTRTASITGAYVALVLALEKKRKDFNWKRLPVLEAVAAVSVGVVGGDVLLDLNYQEDSNAEVDMNLVMTESKRFIEVQAAGESGPFAAEQFDQMRASAEAGILQLLELQRQCLKGIAQ